MCSLELEGFGGGLNVVYFCNIYLLFLNVNWIKVSSIKFTTHFFIHSCMCVCIYTILRNKAEVSQYLPTDRYETEQSWLTIKDATTCTKLHCIGNQIYVLHFPSHFLSFLFLCTAYNVLQRAISQMQSLAACQMNICCWKSECNEWMKIVIS